MSGLHLDYPVGALNGVGTATKDRLERLGITTARDLLWHLPFRYEDYSRIDRIRDIKPGLVTISGTIEQAASRPARTRKLTITEAVISDETGTLKAIWFNQPFLKRKLIVGEQVLLSGKLEFRGGDLALQSPSVEITTQAAASKIVPVYPETAGLSSKQLAALVDQVLLATDDLVDDLPDYVREQYELVSLNEAIRTLHQPSDTGSIERAHHRLAFEELFYLIACGLVIKQEVATEPARPIEFSEVVAKSVTSKLGFKLTDGQRAAAWQILKDLAKEQPMNRLLEGDVGSGKTIVALMAVAMAVAAGYQAALMVPTEILARQHATKLASLAEQLGFKLGLVTSKLPVPERREIARQLAAGEIGLAIGTQALLSADINFQQLGLVVIDEQHRFGVEQRQLLKAKAGFLPHLLTMTATPIPRTLALTVYGDLDISVIQELPPGRKPIKTKLVRESARDQVYAAVEAEIEAGRQVYVVTPLIEDSDTLGVTSLAAEEKRLAKGPFAHRRVAGLHGRMKSDEKDQIMSAFAAGEIDILVATSVIEVGVDVANATVMIIEGADRFGLATLHQLRGRVGRSLHQSYCYLFASPDSDSSDRRLVALERSNDGFRLAQIDLEQRGAGQVYGQRQHGRLDLRFADLGDAKLIAQVRQAAETFVSTSTNMVKYTQAVERINQLKAVTSLD